VDATIGVVDHRAGVELARRGAPVVTRSHLLVVNAFGADAPTVRGAAREALLERRRGRPVIFADCRAGGGVDEVLDWLEHDLLLGAQLP
jgi:urease accessory protein